MRRIGLLLPALALFACNQAPGDQVTTAQDDTVGTETPRPPQPVGPTAEQMAARGSRDCRTVVQAYSDALQMRQFAFAAEFWRDPVIDDARLEALFADYNSPRLAITDVREEGAAGSLYCTVTGTLTGGDDDSDPQDGEIVLRRVNDVDGASEEQLQWTIQSSSFVEPLEQARR